MKFLIGRRDSRGTHSDESQHKQLSLGSTWNKRDENDGTITLNIRNWSLKFASPNVIVAAHEMFARSSCVTRSLTANECTSSFCENVVTVSHLKRRMKAIRAGLCDESGITVRKK